MLVSKTWSLRDEFSHMAEHVGLNSRDAALQFSDRPLMPDLLDDEADAPLKHREGLGDEVAMKPAFCDSIQCLRHETLQSFDDTHDIRLAPR